jgi:ribonuclease Z
LEPFRVHILGCGSALPTLHHNASAQVVEIRGKLFLVDCGEGTQVQLRRSRLRFTKISAVFITHLHGDHCFGLIGMLSTFGLLGRTARLAIYAPAALEDMLKQQMQLFCHDFDYEVDFHAVDTSQQQVIYEDRSLTVESIPLEHRMPCCGYLFREKPSMPHIRRDMIDFYQIPTSQINNIKAGADWTTPDGEVVKNERLVEPADPTRSYAYCSDTRYIPTLPSRIKGVSTLYHESTYGEDNLLMAQKYYHSTARQAALVAREAGVGQLLLGHYSSRYEDEQVLLREAREVFENTHLTDENAVFDV